MIDINVPSEYGMLRTVVMRYAGSGFTADLSRPADLDPVLRRQLATSSWAPYDTAAVRRQQQTLIDHLCARGVEVLLADQVPDCYSQHYTRDIGFAIDDVFIVARLNSRKRQAEIAGLRPLLDQMTKVAFLDAGTVEGGDVMLHDDHVLVGLSEETSPDGVEALRYRLSRLGVDRHVIPITFARPGVVHLDDLFNIVTRDVALIHPPSFPPEQLRWFDDRFDLIAVTNDEARNVEVNTLTLSPTEVVVSASSTRIADQLDARGITTTRIDYSEVTKIPGSFRCTTLPLARR